ncbi:protein Z-dependent protease inhibitor [Sorex fumeus]|uniref:protein Z-dependent protease inhibitor n=1 Tax=Sorex fumeus TaxID=62283 RepID=UPI0024AE7946|nr:protein Z-dependent protease inhibitor [Sorex fumeus]
MTKTCSPQLLRNCQVSRRPGWSRCSGLHADLKTTGLCLLLPCLLAQVQLGTGSNPVRPTPETLEGIWTLPTPTGQDQAYEGLQASQNQTKSGVQVAQNQTNSGVQTSQNQINSGVRATPDPTDNRVQPGQEEADEEFWSLGSRQLSEGISHLSFSLLRKISMKHDDNVAFSPLGLASALVALVLGSKGQTRAELEMGLGLRELTRPGHLPELFRQLRVSLALNQELELAQGSFAFIHQDFDVQENFLHLSRYYLDTLCVPVNFRNISQARALMNYYIDKDTWGKIPKFFDEIDPGTKFILADYIMLRGKWQSPFDPDLTEVDTFHLDKYRTVKVPMMFQAGKFASTFDKTFRCHVLQLPYRGNASMLVVLMENIGDHLALEDYLTPELVDTWLRTLKTRKMEVFFPKFKLDQKYEMHQLLKELGIRQVFSHWADLSEVSVTSRELRVSKVLQRTVIEVDEKGTDAVAGTVSEITAYSMPPIIRVNRPFHFLIYEEPSRTLLFLGRVMDPTVL